MSINNDKSSYGAADDFPESKSRYFLMAKLALGIVGLLSIFAISGTAYAAGGVGSGGGGGGGGGGHQSSYGWGWAIYQTGGPGPTSGFRNGTSWSSVQSTCNKANAKSVYAFIIYDSGGNGEAYDYHTIYESPSEFSGHFKVGASVDHTRATAINTGPGPGTAQDAFDSLPSKGVSTAGYTFGVNVAWFCYDLPTSASLDGVKIDNSRVSSSGSSSGYGGNYSGQQFSDDKVTVSGVGSSTGNPFSFKNIPAGTHTVSVQDSGTSDTNWQVFGYSICKGASSTDVGSCTTQWLTQSGNISGGSSFSYKFVAGGSYHMRWIFAPKGSPPPVVSGACPMHPSDDMAKVAVNLPAQSNAPDTWDLNGTRYYSSPSLPPPPYTLVYTHRFPDSYKITSVKDPDDPTVSITVKQQPSGNSSTGYLDFTNAVKAYPYDTNTADVYYTETYGYTQTTTTVDKDGNTTTSSASGSKVGTWPPSGTYSTTASFAECYPRDFVVSSPTTSVALENNTENPSSATTSNGVTVTFTLPDVPGGTKQVRSPMKLNGLNYTTTYQIARAGSVACTVALGSPGYTFPSIGNATTSGQSVTLSPSQVESISVSVGSASTQLEPGDEVCGSFTTQYGQGEIDENGTIKSGSGSVSTGTAYSEPVVNEPYFKVFGGDISAGNTFEVTNGVVAQCVSSVAAANASVYGWNTAGSSAYNPNQYIKNLPSYNDSSSPYYHVASTLYAGAGAQLSIMAINNINGVASGQNNVNADDAPNNTQGNGLAFANTSTNPSTGLFATSFGKAPACVPDYYADKPGTAPSLSGSIPATADGAYSLSGSVITGGTIGAGKHVVVYATGTVNITGNITFAGGSYDIEDIPSFVLVVKGNINISNSVTQLDGIYIAQPTNPATPTDGTISDCAGINNSNLWAGCANPLAVNGSFIANKIYLLRTGTNDDGLYRENPSIRAALSGESNSLASTYVVDAQQIATCTSGVPDSNGFCGNATYHSGSTYYGPWSAWSADTRGCGITSSSPRSSTSTTQYNNQYVSGLCASGYRWQSRSISTSSSYYSCPSGETVSGAKCKAKITYTCTDGSTPDSLHKCTIHVTPTHASEVFNYSPAFWLTLSLQNASSQNALKYDSVTSLPPVL